MAHDHDHDHDHDDHEHDHGHGREPTHRDDRGASHDHGHGHDHDHHHDHDHEHGHGHHHHDLSGTTTKALTAALCLTLVFLIVELVVGWLAGSLALLSDAGHMLTDAGALGLALFAQRLAARPRSPQNTFGLRRAEILAALLNGLVLGVSAAWIVIEAIERLAHPPEVKGGWVLVVASIGLVINLLSAWILSRGASNSNVRAALAHVLADAAGSVAAMVAGALVMLFGWAQADPIVSILISLLILWGAFGVVRGAVQVLLEGTPTNVDIPAVEATIKATPGVSQIHDLHVWSIADGFPVLTVHVVLDGTAHGVEVVRLVGQRLHDLHGIDHVTVQPEAPECALIPITALRRDRRSAS